MKLSRCLHQPRAWPLSIDVGATMSTLPRTSGIYKWTCTPTEKIYIGSTINIYKRYYDHLKTLRGNRHINPHFQSAWNKHGESAFEFQVIELILPLFLLEREQYWLDRTEAYKKHKGFNICPTAGSSLGQIRSESAGNNISAAKATPQNGYISPSGEHITIENLRSFCREHGLKISSMRALALGKQAKHCGWTHMNAAVRAENGSRKVRDGFIDPQGNIVPPFHNLGAFCQEHGLGRTSMLWLSQGKVAVHKGWSHVNAAECKAYTGIIDPIGNEMGPIYDLTVFCREHGLDVSSMFHLYSGKYTQYRRWTRRK